MGCNNMSSLENKINMFKSYEIGIAASIHIKIQNSDRIPLGCLLMKDPDLK